MSGHGWVMPRADGNQARCGGPALCSECAAELAEVEAQETASVRELAEIRGLALRKLKAGERLL